MALVKHWLTYLGGRRPGSLADQAQYAETVSRPKAEPVAHDLPATQAGHSLGAGPNRRARRNHEGRHRA